ncbi:hypothetical protein DDB_G0285623 [Dictyostelium discoideum AX4]|uniref:Uncharacterized protein n=1 Tax=Dictyostelium discoideum TaxID=44689 RepID=Q54MX3_DICDI|nr:hypothetical protein DDB_G0285623 [Dictyostelium discoideum AX4]EAL64649.1 hypothetical protein DDB_G0285623 [Dictyostelium discoideum AX4]|eukprot:XP_638170.1 hypothetical protein DDB_G0285623 [Dictyostelium discoideum AX4]
MFFQIPLVIILSLVCFSNSLVTNYIPAIGRDLINPADIPRAALPTYSNQLDALQFSKAISYEVPEEVFNITFSKYYLNNIVALSTSNTFGAVSHYNNLISLYNDANNIAFAILNNTIGNINTITKYTNYDPSKFDTISTSINNLKSSIDTIKQSATSLASAMNSTKNSLLPSTPNAATVQVVKDNYDLAIKSVILISNRFNLIKNELSDILSLMPTCKEEVEFYVDSLTSDEDYMGNMNSYMKLIFIYANSLYSRSLLFTRLKELF